MRRCQPKTMLRRLSSPDLHLALSAVYWLIIERNVSRKLIMAELHRLAVFPCWWKRLYVFLHANFACLAGIKPSTFGLSIDSTLYTWRKGQVWNPLSVPCLSLWWALIVLSWKSSDMSAPCYPWREIMFIDWLTDSPMIDNFAPNPPPCSLGKKRGVFFCFLFYFSAQNWVRKARDRSISQIRCLIIIDVSVFCSFRVVYSVLFVIPSFSEKKVSFLFTIEHAFFFLHVYFSSYVSLFVILYLSSCLFSRLKYTIYFLLCIYIWTFTSSVHQRSKG